MTQNFVRILSRSMTAASALAVIHIGSAAAADASADFQQQVRESVSGSHTAFAAPRLDRDNTVAAKTGGVRVDTQEYVRGLLQGLTPKRTDSPPASAERASLGSSAHTDMQASVRSMLMGE